MRNQKGNLIDEASKPPAGQGGAADNDAANTALPGDNGENQLNEEEILGAIKEDMKQVLEEEKMLVKDEWNYLDTFFKRFNKVHLDVLAIKKERMRLKTENTQLRSILKQFLDGVAVSEEILSKPNPLFVVNGKVNLNYVPPKREPMKKVVVEAAHVHLS